MAGRSGNDTRTTSGIGGNTGQAAAAFAISGLASYAVLILVGRRLALEPFGVFAGFWSLSFFLAGSSQAPIEQEISRVVSDAVVRDLAYAATVRRLGRLMASVVAAMAALVAMLWLLDGARFFGGDVWVACAAGATIASEAAVSFGRGLWAGRRRFDRFARLVATQGVVRAACIGILFIAGVQHVAWFALAIAVGNVVALAASRFAFEGIRAEPSGQPIAGVVRNVGFLALAAPFYALFTIGGPAVAKAIATTAQQADVGRLLAAISLTSAPIFLFTAIQSAILPHFAALAADDDHRAFRLLLTRMLGVIAAIGALGIGATFLIGNRLLGMFFGEDKQIDRLHLVTLVVATVFLMFSLGSGPAVVAMGGHATLAAGWALGAAAFGAALLSSADLITRIARSMAVGTGTAATVLFLAMWWRRRVGASVPDPTR